MNGNNKDISPPTPEELQEVGVDSPKKDNGIPPPTPEELEQAGISLQEGSSPKNQVTPPTFNELRSMGVQTAHSQPVPFDTMATSSFRENVIGSDRSRNPIVNFGETFWNVSSKQVPSLMQAGLAATQFGITNQAAEDRFLRSRPSTAEALDEIIDEEEALLDESRIRNLQSAIEGMDEFQQAQEGAVISVRDIDDTIDAINWVANSVGQAAAQIPASVLTKGLTSVGQEVGIIYMDQVKKIAEREGIEPEEVIRQGMDDRASAVAYGAAAGALDFLGAKKAMGMLPFDKFKSDLARRSLSFLQSAGTEFATEGSQSIIEQFGASAGSGQTYTEALTGVNLMEAVDEAAAGAAGGGGVNIATQIASDVVKKGRGTIEKQETVEPVEAPDAPTEQEIETPQAQDTTPDQPAQQTPAPEETTTRPEPIPSFDQPAPVLEGDYQIEFTEGDTVIREDYQVDTQRTPVVTNTRTGKPVERSSRNYVPALAEYFTRLDDSGKRVDAPLLEEGVTLDEGEYVSRVAQESESPTEILEAIEVHQQTDPNSPAILDDAISNVLWQEGHTITRNDLEQFADPALIEGDQGRFYRLQLQKEGAENTDLANLTQMVNDRLNTDYSTSDIMDHWLDYHDARRNQTDPTLDKLKQRFEQVTGEPYSPRLAREVSIRQDAARESASAQEMRMADDVVSKVGDNVFDEQGEIVQSEFASEIEQLQQTDPQLADYLTRQPDEQARQQQTQQEPQQPGLQDRAQQEPVQQTPEGDQGVTQPPSDYGQSNRIINREEHEQNRRELLRKLGGQAPSNPFMDAQALKLAAKVALFHVEAGARKFSDFAAAMINDIGDQVKPYLANLYRAAAEKAEVPNSQFSTDEEISAWTQQNLTAEQRQQSPQGPIDLSDVQTPEQPVSAEWAPPTPRQLEEAITTANKDKSDYIKRRLKDPQDNPEFTEGLEEIGDYQVQSTVQANLEADRLVDDFMDNLGDKAGLRELFNLLKKGMIPPLMGGPLSAKITMKMQELGMNDEALAVNDWKQQQARESARFIRSLQSDASPEETVTRVFAGLTKAKQQAMSEEGPKGDGRSWKDIMSDIFQQLRDLKKQADQNPEIDFQSRAIELVEEALRPVGTETRTEQNQRRAAAKGIVEGFNDGQTIESLSDQLAEMAEFEVLDQELKDRLLEQAEKVSQLSNEGKRELAYNAWEDLMNDIQQEGLSSRPLQEMFTDLWYTAVLSGLTTQARSQKGSIMTSTIFMAFRLMFNPVAAPLMISQIAKGFKGGIGTYMHILKTGRSDIRFGDYKMTVPRLTIQLLNTKMKELGVSEKALKTMFAFPTYMYNSIKGVDANIRTGYGEGNAALMEYYRAKESSKSRAEALQKAQKALAVDQEQQAAKQAAYEVEQMKERGENIPAGYEKRRAREIVIEQRDQKMMKRAWDDAARAALVSNPIGLLGEIYQGLNQGMKEGSQAKQWVSLATRFIMAPFMRVWFNYFRFGLSFTPSGFVMGQADTVFDPNVGTKDQRRPVDKFERNEYYGRAATGSAIFIGFFLSMFDNDEDEGWQLKDEDDRWLDITGNLTGNWWEEKDTKPGIKPWAVRARNPFTGEWSGYYSYIDNPIGFGLAPIGMMRDEFVHREFQKDVSDREEIRNKKHRGMDYLFTSGMYGMFRYAMDQSFNQGLNNIEKLATQQEAEDWEERVYDTFGRPVQGLYPNLYNQLYTQYRALMDIPEKEANGFWENMGKKVPILDDLIKQKKVDVFGYPVVRDLDTPMIPDWLLKQAKDNLNYREEIPEWQLVHKYEEVVIGSFYAPETFKGKKVPDPVREKFVERAGELMRTQVQGNYRALNSMEPVDLQRELNRMKGFAYRQARLELVERPFRFGEWDDINE